MISGPWLEVLITWFPILLLGLIFLYVGLRSQSVYTGKSGKTHGEMLEEHITEMRRQNDLLEKLIRDQEQRLQRLEATRRSSSGGGGGGGGR